MTDLAPPAPRPAHPTRFGHPIGLVNLFGVELWERFSFYGMLTILGYYLYYSMGDGGLGLPKATATGIVGAYGGLVYLSTVLGGWMADRVLGMERTVFYGGVVVMCGHISLAILPGLTGVAVGLVMLVVVASYRQNVHAYPSGGGDYEVVAVVRHSETLEPLVLYRALYGDGGLWVRPHAMFLEQVESDGRLLPRFSSAPSADA